MHSLISNKRPLKILWFTNTASLAAPYLNQPVIGGGWIESLERKIKEQEGIELAVAFRDGEKELNKFTHEGGLYFAIPQKKQRVKGFIDRHIHFLNDDELVQYCLHIVNDFKPDIINIFGTESGFGLISNKVSMPVVIHLQGILTIYEKKWFASGITKWALIHESGIKSMIKGTSLLHDYKNFRRYATRERKIFKACKFFLGRTDWDKRVTNTLSPHSKYYCSNEILRNDFYTVEWSKKRNETKVFISTIQAVIYKGLETVLESAILLTQLNAFSFKWIIAGISEEDAVVRIFEKKVGKKMRDFNIVLSGKLASKELIEIERNADIFIHPSHIDNSPNSVCEAMLLGMPVIATYTGGTGSLLNDREEGLLIQDGDPVSMAGTIVELVSNPDFAAQLGKNARNRALKRHNKDEIVSNLMRIYSEMLASNIHNK